MNDRTDKLSGDLIRWMREYTPTIAGSGLTVTLDCEDGDQREELWRLLWAAIDADGANRESEAD